jgi:hypothetical protein
LRRDFVGDDLLENETAPSGAVVRGNTTAPRAWGETGSEVLMKPTQPKKGQKRLAGMANQPLMIYDRKLSSL